MAMMLHDSINEISYYAFIMTYYHFMHKVLSV